MSIPSTFDAVKLHLAQVQENPSTALDVALIEKLQLQLIESTDALVPATLLSQISALLPVLQEEPAPLTTLGIKATTFSPISNPSTRRSTLSLASRPPHHPSTFSPYLC
jgi:hypothetical protein